MQFMIPKGKFENMTDYPLENLMLQVVETSLRLKIERIASYDDAMLVMSLSIMHWNGSEITPIQFFFI